MLGDLPDWLPELTRLQTLFCLFHQSCGTQHKVDHRGTHGAIKTVEDNQLERIPDSLFGCSRLTYLSCLWMKRNTHAQKKKLHQRAGFNSGPKLYLKSTQAYRAAAPHDNSVQFVTASKR